MLLLLGLVCGPRGLATTAATLTLPPTHRLTSDQHNLNRTNKSCKVNCTQICKKKKKKRLIKETKRQPRNYNFSIDAHTFLCTVWLVQLNYSRRKKKNINQHHILHPAEPWTFVNPLKDDTSAGFDSMYFTLKGRKREKSFQSEEKDLPHPKEQTDPLKSHCFTSFTFGGPTLKGHHAVLEKKFIPRIEIFTISMR